MADEPTTDAVRRTPPEPSPCGHADLTSGCGGCDPGAVEYVRDDGGPWRWVDQRNYLPDSSPTTEADA